MTWFPKRFNRPAALAAVLTFAACSEPKPPTNIASTTPLSGTTATVGTNVAIAPAVKVTNKDGGGVAGVVVTFAVTSGGGTVGATSATTAGDGTASAASWTLGITAGTNTLTASVEGLTGSPVTFTAAGTAGPATTVTLNDGDGQTASVSTPVLIKPSVRVFDAHANPVANVTVNFAVTGGNGTVTGGSVLTTNSGLATVGSWIVGPTPGANSMSASAAGVATPVLFNATAQQAPLTMAVAASAGDKQAVMAGAPVVTKPSVLVSTNGAPTPGVTVTFTVISGGGSITGGTVTTDANGIAAVGSWTLGSAAGLNSLSANVTGSGVTNNPILFTASGCTGGGGTGYKLTICFTSDMTAAQKAAFATAAARWESIITSDISDITFPSTVPQGTCGVNTYEIPAGTVVDDLLLFAQVVPIDGVNGVLGSAGPCLIRSGTSANPRLSVVGTMRFDVADVDLLAGNGGLAPVLLHEMGHVIGIGSLWNQFTPSFLVNPSTSGGPSFDTYFNGPAGIAGFNLIGGSTYTLGQKVPVENAVSAGAGTINSHWREGVLQNELMTGFLQNGSNPLSVMTIMSLQDLGYTVDTSKADSFSLVLNILAPGTSLPLSSIDLRNDAYVGPLHVVDSRGRLMRIR